MSLYAIIQYLLMDDYGFDNDWFEYVWRAIRTLPLVELI